MAPRKRAAVRLLMFLVQHSAPVSALLYLLGVAGVLALPFFARNTYIDENAMLAGSGATSFGYGDASNAVAAMHAAAAAVDAATRVGGGARDVALRSWLASELRASGLHAQEHAFDVAPRRRHSRGELRGVNVVSVARAQRGDGKEALVLVTPLGDNATLGLGVGVALLRHLAQTGWLARDVLWLAAADGVAGGAHAAAEAWLADYHEQYGAVWGVTPPPTPPQAGQFLRAGVLTAALVLEAPRDSFDTLQLRMQGTQGALPNLDMLGLLRALTGSTRVQLHSGERSAREAGHASTWSEYALSARAAARFLARQARGEPDGVHGAFLDASVEAATVAAVMSQRSGRGAQRGADAALQLGQMLEGSVRSLSNLLERLHHSSAFYIMLSPERFVGAAVYMPPVGVLLGGLLLCAAAGATRGAGEHWPQPPQERDWVHGLATAAGVYGGSAAAGALLLHVMLPLRMEWPWHSSRPSQDMLLLCWATAAALLAAAGFRAAAWVLGDARPLRDGPWVPLKSLMLAATCLWLAQAVILNTGLALPCALLLAPASLAARPAPPGAALSRKGRAARGMRWLLLLAASPPVVVWFAGCALRCSPSDVLWRVACHAAEWDTLCFPLAFGAYLPCILVCAAILSA